LSFSGNWAFYRVQQDEMPYNMRSTMQSTRVDNDDDNEQDDDDDDDDDSDDDDAMSTMITRRAEIETRPHSK